MNSSLPPLKQQLCLGVKVNLNNDSPEFNFGKILKISRMLKMLSADQCLQWLIHCYLPIINSTGKFGSFEQPITLKRIILQFLCLYHSKTKHPITNDQLNLLINFKPKNNDTSLNQQQKQETETSKPNAAQSNAKCQQHVQHKISRQAQLMKDNTINVNNNDNNSFYKLPESVISHNICPFLPLNEIIQSFSKVCSLFAICCENGNIVKSLHINDDFNYKRNSNIGSHLYKCWKMEKLVINSSIDYFRQGSFWIKYIASFCNLKCIKIKRMFTCKLFVNDILCMFFFCVFF